MKILLHICCAPCSIHPFRELLKNDKDLVAGFFYNPNIHPFTEMEKRRGAIADYAKSINLDIVFGGYDMEDFFKNIGTNMQAPSRCRICWKMRLEKTAKYAKEAGFDAFTSTLLVSPYQDRQAILEIGSEIEDETGVKFLSDDWRSGFRQAQQCARENNIYRQKYCGCVFSEKERFAKNG